MGVGASSVFKASSLFCGFFGLQMAVVPDFLMSENFQKGSYNLDRWHYFILRGSGCALLSLSANYWQMADQADKFMLANTITFTAMACAFPLFAEINLPVKHPQHYLPVVGCGLLLAGHISCLMKPAGNKK